MINTTLQLEIVVLLFPAVTQRAFGQILLKSLAQMIIDFGKVYHPRIFSVMCVSCVGHIVDVSM